MVNKPITICTDFLNPKELEYAISLLQNQGMNYSVSGGYEGYERAVILMGEYMEPERISEEIQTIKISSTEKLTHPSLLGSILGLGLERKKIGDIRINEKSAYIIVKKSIAQFIIQNLQKVGRSNVHAELYEGEIHTEDILTMEKRMTVSSMRLDVILSGMLNISRGKSGNLIQKGSIKVNYELTNSRNKMIEEGDMISIRKQGRFTLKKIIGESKKGKFIVLFEKIL